MQDKPSVAGEVVLKEYPNSTRWLEGQQVIGVGNLILTNERLVFLHRVPLDEKELEYIHKFSEKATASEVIDLASSLHKKNFQVPLSSVLSVKTKLFSLLPFPRPCLRLSYQSEKKKKQVKELTFMFTIPLWKGWFQLEFTTVKLWEKLIRGAVSRRQAALHSVNGRKKGLKENKAAI